MASATKRGLATKKNEVFLKLYLGYFKTQKKFLLPLSSSGEGIRPNWPCHEKTNFFYGFHKHLSK